MRELAIVTGATGGIGRVIARELAKAGFDIVVHYASREEDALRIAGSVRRLGARAWPVKADLASPEGVQEFSEDVAELMRIGEDLRLSVLVNNASHMLSPSFGSITSSSFDDFFSLNVRAPLLLTQCFAALMVDGSSIVNVSSAAAHFASPNDLVYAMSKNALEAMTRHAAPALAAKGIRINAVIPGFTDNGHPAFQDDAVRAHMGSFAVMGGVADPQVVADAVAFLVSAASRTTGSTLDVSGGSTIAARPRSESSLSLRAIAYSDDPAPLQP